MVLGNGVLDAVEPARWGVAPHRVNDGTVRCWGSNDSGQTAGSSVTAPIRS